ncbi:MAG: hypothetical protein IJO93_01735 [Clostridia bacterium]|nr:hypothetical protein [Clostridia bacterium]
MQLRYGFDEIANYFPQRLRGIILSALNESNIEEIRIRVDKPIQVMGANLERLYHKYIVTKAECDALLESFCQHSVYSCEEDMRHGFITLPTCGVRVGLSGSVTERHGHVERFRSVTGFCIRIPCEHLHCSATLCAATGGLSKSLLIASSPGVGKTTLLRDMARELSDVYMKKVCIVDERSEIAGSYFGIPSFNVGVRTDVIDNCPKKDGMEMALRTLSPHVLITDELGEQAEFDCVFRAMHSGVHVAVSVHSDSLDDIAFRFGALSDAVGYIAVLKVHNARRICILKDTSGGMSQMINLSREEVVI